MKKSLLLILLAVVSMQYATSQSQRKVLIEHFTQASCGPCASVNPIITPIIERNKNLVTKITHQVSWPGVDPMNKDNPGDVQNRVSYYGVTGVPDVFLDAYSSGNPTATITDATIQNAYQVPSPYEISISNTLLPDYNSLRIDVTVKLTGVVSGSPSLRVAALEKVITWTTPPGTNGERVFHHVLKKFLPNTNGVKMPEITKIGESHTYSYIYKFDKLYDFKNLETAAFIQNDATKEVYQSENAAVIYTPSPSDDAVIKLSNATGVFGDSIICGNTTSPIVKVLNAANKSITSLDFVYSVKGGPSSNYRWTGKIDYLKEVNITLPAISFNPFKGINQMRIEIANVNDAADYNTINNSNDLSFYAAPNTTNTSKFEMKPGTQPAGLSFAIYNDKNQIILQDGPFSNSTAKTYDLNLEQDQCYRVIATNTTNNLNGTFKVFDNQNVQIFQQRVIGIGSVTRDFSTYNLVTDTKEEAGSTSWTVYPNPADQTVSLKYQIREAQDVQLQVHNTSGKTCLVKTISLQAGVHEIPIELTEYVPGIYFLSLKTRNDILTSKIIVR